MDNELTIIPGHVYQCWLQNASDISSRRRKKGWQKHNQLFSMKINNLMGLPPVALVSGLENATGEVHYPAPLMEQWAKLITTRLHPPEPSSSSSPKRRCAQDPPEFPVEDFQSGIGSKEQQISIEKLRANLDDIEQIAVVDALKRNQFVTPGSSEHSARSIPSSGSGHSLLQFDPEIQLPSGRLRKRQHSSSGHSLGGLDPVEEDIPWQQNGRDPKLRRLSENGTTPDFELLEETAPTQTPMPAKSPLMDEITRSIQTQLKVHFDTPGAPQVESLNQLAFGMTRRKAALLFYQTCVLASADYLRVEQRVAYEDISISRGPKM
ncbi:sister chromatid cohesion 1 protein 1 [Cinnamomum micranthum f. kanehirae]|uniref:Sister chromatid cohesion 1 protein 1 n=1 Tax=Cinnamomum micranthum f. kanehirae TaxID=337451 RepID=A0A3S3Q9N5_9MAGN|nr:sister chromatid cohesion 1 protein 1 [Cinnamomum micranthum f. kanehirae]